MARARIAGVQAPRAESIALIDTRDQGAEGPP
jgi:hypothetical protein